MPTRGDRIVYVKDSLRNSLAARLTRRKRGLIETVKLAVLGLNQGAKIVRDALKHREVELVTVAGFGEQAESIASELGLKRYEDYRLLLRQEQLDAVAIALPNGLHVEAVEEALAAGIPNILLEKPLANSVEEAQHIIDICKEAKATLLIGYFIDLCRGRETEPLCTGEDALETLRLSNRRCPLFCCMR